MFIEVQDIYKSFDEKQVLTGITLQIEKGEAIAVIGPSGCGKSTLLRLLIGLLKPDRGNILIGGEEITRFTPMEMDRWRTKMGMVFQSSALFDSLTVGENVGFMLYEHSKLRKKEIEKIVDEKLEIVGLSGTSGLYPSELSGGMMKRVSFARAIAMNPEIVFYDEPTTGLDPITSTKIEDLMKSMQKRLNITSVIVTHQISTIRRAPDRVFMLHKGNFIGSGTPEVMWESDNPVIHQFMHGLAEGPIHLGEM